MKVSVKILMLLSFVLTIALNGCVTKKEVFNEPEKDLNGTWKISKVTRNATDLTSYIDYTGFRLMLADDKSYTLNGNNIPFLVNKGGTWSVNDPLYPYKLSFKPTDSTNAFTGDIGTPVSKGQRNIEITFSPGCRANTYVYTLEKIL